MGRAELNYKEMWERLKNRLQGLEKAYKEQEDKYNTTKAPSDVVRTAIGMIDTLEKEYREVEEL